MFEISKQVPLKDSLFSGVHTYIEWELLTGTEFYTAILWKSSLLVLQQIPNKNFLLDLPGFETFCNTNIFLNWASRDVAYTKNST